MSLAKVIANGVLFQIGWFLCVLQGDQVAMMVVPASLAIYWLFFTKELKDYLLILAITLFGITGDALLGALGILQFANNTITAPLWMISLWVLFATTIPWSLNWLIDNRNKFVGFSTLGGTTSYFAGVRLTDIEFGYSMGLTIMLILIAWFLYGLALHAMIKRWKLSE